MINLQRLHYFVAVARHEHIGRAAQELHVSQSPLSRQILALESELGIQLFARERKRLKLTSAGRQLLTDAERLLEGAASLERRAEALSAGTQGSITIGYVEGAVYGGALPRDLKRLRRRAPSARVELVPMRSREQEAALRSGTIDVGYAYSAAPDELTSELVLDEPFMLAVPRASSAATSSAPIAALAGARLITLPESAAPGARAAMIEACARLGLRPALQLEARDPAVVLALVASGLGFAIVQKSLRALAPDDVRMRPLPQRFGLRLQVHRWARADASPIVAGLAGRP